MFPPPILPNADIGYGQQQDRPQESQDHALHLVAKCDASVSPSLDTSLSSLAWCDLDTEEHCAIVLDHSAVWVCAMLLPVRFSSCIWAGCLGTARLSPRTTSTAAGCRVFCHVTLHHYHCVAGAAQVSPRASRGHADIPHLLELPARNVSSQQWILPTTITAVSLRCDLQLSSLLPHLEKTGRKRCAPPPFVCLFNCFSTPAWTQRYVFYWVTTRYCCYLFCCSNRSSLATGNHPGWPFLSTKGGA